MDKSELVSDGKLVVESQIYGSFNGFNGGKLFPLYYGQYWIQATYMYWYYYSYMPHVKIYQYGGKHYITINGLEQFIEVRRITDVMKATIVSDFNGWTGDTIFELDNGQVWKQAEYDYDYNYSYRPDALIYANGYGHTLVVEGNSVAVTRIK